MTGGAAELSAPASGVDLLELGRQAQRRGAREESTAARMAARTREADERLRLPEIKRRPNAWWAVAAREKREREEALARAEKLRKQAAAKAKAEKKRLWMEKEVEERRRRAARKQEAAKKAKEAAATE